MMSLDNGDRPECASEEEVLRAVVEATRVFSKGGEERERFVRAVQEIVTGRLNIKESSIEHGFPATTIHPYVHKARAILGPSAPPLKNPPRSSGVRYERRGDRFASAAVSSGLFGGSGSHLKHFSGGGTFGGERSSMVSGLSLLHHKLDANENQENGAHEDEGLGLGDLVNGSDLFGSPTKLTNGRSSKTASLFGDDPFMDGEEGVDEMGVNYNAPLSPEEAAQEAIAAIDAKDIDRPKLFMACVRVLCGTMTLSEAAEHYAVAEVSLDAHIKEARTMIASEEAERDAVERRKSAPVSALNGTSGTLKAMPRSIAPPNDSSVQSNSSTSLPPVTSEEIRECAKRVISGSSYAREAKERLLQAVFETVENNLPSTQAAHKYTIPFSTLHPYVKRTRIELGLVDETTIIDENGRRRTVPLVDANGAPVTKRLRVGATGSPVVGPSQNGGSFGTPIGATGTTPSTNTITPFKPVKIPESWKQHPDLLCSAVERAIVNCKAANVEKRKQLADAVFEVVSGRHTMKAAASMYDVPFTTLQTYFHRARVLLVQELGDDPCPRRDGIDTQYESPFNKGLPQSNSVSSDLATMVSTERGSQSPMPTRRGGALDALTQKLHARTGGADADSLETDSNSSASARKRSAKQTLDDIFGGGGGSNSADDDWLNGGTAIATTDGTDTESVDNALVIEPQAPEDEWGDDSRRTSIDNPLAITATYTSDAAARIEDDWMVEDGTIMFTVERAVEKATKNTHFQGPQREQMITALVEAVYGRASLRDAARARGINVGTLHNYYHRARSMVDAVRAGCRPTDVLQMSASQATAAARKIKDVESGLFAGIDRSTMTQEEMCREAIDRVVRSSLYPPEQKDRLRKAVSKVIFGAKTINYAANMYGLPSSTVHPYVHRVRAALGDNCPPQAGSQQPHIYSFDGQTIAATDDNLGASVRSSMAARGFGNTSAAATTLASSGLSFNRHGRASMRDTIRQIRDMQSGNSRELSPSIRGSSQKREAVDLDRADAIVQELVRTSLYGDAGRRKLYEAVLMVITDSATCSEAARTYGIPASTIQPYIQKARVALANPDNPDVRQLTNRAAAVLARSLHSSQPSTPRSTDDVYASDSEIEAACREAVDECPDGVDEERRDELIAAALAVISADMTVREACDAFSFGASLLHSIVARVRQTLGIRCPPAKVASTSNNDDSCGAQLLRDDVSASGSQLGGEDDGSAGAALRREVAMILNRYSYKGDRGNLLHAVLLNVGEHKSLAECCSVTGLAQTTLSTYTRIVRMLVPKEVLDAYEAERRLNGRESSITRLNAPPSLTRYSPSPSRTSPSIKAPVTTSPKRDAEEDFTSMFDCDGSPDDIERDERRTRACIWHVVRSQYRRPPAAQQQLCGAIEDVLLNGLAASEASRTHQDVSEHVLNAYVQRVRTGLDCLDAPLRQLRERCRDDFHDGVESLLVDRPVAISLLMSINVFLQEDTQSPHEKVIRLPEHIEMLLIDYLRDLESANFPLTPRFCGGLLRCVLDCNEDSPALLHATSAWQEWQQHFNRRNELKQ